MYHDVFNFSISENYISNPIFFDFHVFLSASSTPSLREKKIWQNEQTLWPHIYTTNVEIRKLWPDISRCFLQFLRKKRLLLKHRKCKVCLSFQLLEIETGRHSNCFSYSTSGWASDHLVGVIRIKWKSIYLSIKGRKCRISNSNIRLN